MNAKRLIVMAVIVLLVAAFFAFDLGRFLTLEYLQRIITGSLYLPAPPGRANQ